METSKRCGRETLLTRPTLIRNATKCEKFTKLPNGQARHQLTDLATQVAQSIADGLLFGAIYALAALGLSLIFSALGVLNLSHGDFVMVGGFVGFYFATQFAVSRYGFLSVLGILLVSFVVIALLGAVYEFAFIRIALKRPPNEILISSILVTVGTAFVIENVGFIYIPKFIPFQLSVFSIPINLTQLTFNYGGVFLDGVKVLALITILISTLLLFFFSRRTYVGKSMRAITQNREATLLMGVNLQRISLLTFAIGSGFGALAGVSIAMTNNMSPGFGLPYTISLLSVMVLGGTRSYWGPLIGGLVIGFVEIFIQAPFLNPLTLPGGIQIVNLEYWAPAVSIVFLIVVLMIKPTGLTGSRVTGTKA
jgi:branched-chain amino acid transport system permease protein